MRILYITKENPSGALGHAAERGRQFLLELKSKGHEVQSVYPSNGNGGHLSGQRTYAEKLLSVFKSYHEKRAGQKFCKDLKNMIEAGQFDFIVAEELSAVFLALKAGAKHPAPICYIAHNVESDLYTQIVGPKIIEKIRAKNLLSTETWVLKNADLVFSFSSEDREKLKSISGRQNILLTRAGVRWPSKVAEASKNEKVIFVGALDYFPNIQGLQWYADKIHPLIKRKYEMVVIGRNPGSLVKSICQKNNFALIPSPSDLDSLLKQAGLEVVPLLSGSGTRGKILEAAAYGIPVISTTLGAQGLGFKDRENIILADTAEQFAAKVQIYLDEPLERTKIATAALKYAQHFNYKSVVADFLDELTRFK